jgi:hypothetical protein
MVKTMVDRRVNQRYQIQTPVHFRVSLEDSPSRWGSGITCDISSTGVAFRCRRALPLGAHVEMVLEWPARSDESNVEMRATGLVIRCSSSKAVVRITSHRFRTAALPAQPLSATA